MNAGTAMAEAGAAVDLDVDAGKGDQPLGSPPAAVPNDKSPFSNPRR